MEVLLIEGWQAMEKPPDRDVILYYASRGTTKERRNDTASSGDARWKLDR
jgi:hypothetical protein